MAEQASPYRSMPGTPVGSGEKKKKGIKKIISGFTKKHNPIPEAKGFEPTTNGNGERVHFRDKIPSFFKRGPKDGEISPSDPVHPLKELLDQELKGETVKEETKPGIHKQSDVQDEDTNKHNLAKKAEEVIDSLIHRNRHVHAPAVTEYSKLEKSNPSPDVVEPKPAERAEEDQIPHDHNQINTGNEVVATEEVETGPTLPVPPPPPLPAQENEAFGCETLAKGVQKICLPWTLNKDQD